MGKSKVQEYSSDSDGSSDDEEIEKSRKHKKKSSKKKHKKHKSKKSKKSSKSSDEDDQWIETNIEMPTETEKSTSAATQREDWMSADNFFLPTFSKEKQQPKSVTEKLNYEIYNPSTSVRELNPYWKTGEGGLPSFKKPADDDDVYQKTSGKVQSNSSGNWRKSKAVEIHRRISRSRSKSPDTQQTQLTVSKATEEKLSHSDFLTDAQMNEIGAKMIKAEIMGNAKLASELKEKLERAKELKKSGKIGTLSAGKEKVILSITNSAGVSRPVAKADDDSKRNQNNKRQKRKRVETHQDGERLKYYPDDDKYDIKQMVRLRCHSFSNHILLQLLFSHFQFEHEKMSADNKDQDIEFAKAISKMKDSQQMDMADIFSDTIRKDKNKKSDDRDEAIREHNRMERILDTCYKCFDSPKMNKDLIVHVGNKIYLSIPHHEGLVKHHLIISPIQHNPCSTMIDEDVWQEIIALKKALSRFFFNQKEDAVFFETVKFLHRRPHMEIHCIAHKDFEMIQFYFKKAILEAEHTQNKKLIVLKDNKDIRRSVPKELPYFWIDFGHSGFAHVIENQEEFPSNFAMEIIGGMLNLDNNKWRKPRREHQPTKKTSYFNSILKDVIKNL